MKYNKVLLVEDDEDDQEIFQYVLKEVSPSTTCAISYTGLDALKKLGLREVEPDCIFLDLNMPVMNGFQFLTQIKANENFKHIPVVVYSTASNIETAEQVKALGASAFITKPHEYNTLLDTMQDFFKAG
jgi:CheY-like chemotaxis protein